MREKKNRLNECAESNYNYYLFRYCSQSIRAEGHILNA